MKNSTRKSIKNSFVYSVSILSAIYIMFTNAAIPNGYYDSVDQTTSPALRNSLNNIIKDHTRFPYTSTATDTWDILETADQDPDVANNVITIYKNASYGKEGGGNSFYNREHTWPKSYGFPNDGSTNYPYTDTHHLFIADSGYNSSRSNKPYANCAGCSEKITEFNNGRGGVDSSWTAGSFSTGSWETWNARKGDVARALMYMDVRYEGGVHSITSVSEPDLILTDDRNLIAASSTGSNGTVAYMGLLTTLIQWHKDDPVDDFERRHTDTVYSFQGNRNPFIDHPEYVECVFENVCNGGGGSDITPPSSPTNLTAIPRSGLVDLTWDTNIESDLAGYNIYQSTTSGGTGTLLNTSLVVGTNFADTNVVANTTYYYVITAVDTSGNESLISNEDFATPTDGGTGQSSAWINEFHYDNSGSDVGEFVEVAGSANFDLSGWQIIAYNGNGGGSYKTTNLSGIISDQQNGFGALSFLISGLQNGAPDGLALVDGAGAVVQFLSYEGTFTATNGAANGMTSVSVGVSETTSTSAGQSLQLTGTGQSYSDFNWQSPASDSPGLINSGQSFSDITPPSSPTNLTAIAGTDLVDLTWDTNIDSDLAGYNIYQSTTSGGTGTLLNISLVVGTNYTDTNVVANTTYYYVITAVDTSGNESLISNEDFATPTDGGNGQSSAWINEFHYDNSGSDIGEFVEVAGSANLDLSGWQIIAYNGNGGGSYKTTNLSGIISDQQNGFGTLSFLISGLQNGAPDGIALVDESGTVVQFLSYEGTFTATNGAANGTTSVSVGVSETASTSAGQSLQLTGTGQNYSDFVWQSPASDSPGFINSGQSFSGTNPPQNQLPVAIFTYSCSNLSCNFDASASSDPDGQISDYAWVFGDGNFGINVNPSYAYIAASTYNVTLTVTDNGGATSSSTQAVTVQDAPPELSFFENTTTVSIPDNDAISSDITVNRSGLAGTVDVSVNITHTYRGDISLVLTAPDGLSYTLKSKNGGDSANDVIETFTINVTGNAQGLWVLNVGDNFNQDIGDLNSWSLQF